MSAELNIGRYLADWLKRWDMANEPGVHELAAAMQTQALSAGDMVVHAGDNVDSIYFVADGLLRLYYLSPDGKERNKDFFGPGAITGAVSAVITGGTAPFSNQALDPSVLIRANFSRFQHFIQHSSRGSEVYIELLSEAFIRNERREAMLLTCDAEQRYRWLLEHEADLLQRLPQYHIASYLGVDAVSLSRIKKKLETDSPPDRAGPH
jgi:CRP-like cAMP-binding protein